MKADSSLFRPFAKPVSGPTAAMYFHSGHAAISPFWMIRQNSHAVTTSAAICKEQRCSSSRKGCACSGYYLSFLCPDRRELLFETFSQRYERASTLVTGNHPFQEWTEVFGFERLTGALLDRLTHHVHILEMNGDSYRLKHSRRKRTPPQEP